MIKVWNKESLWGKIKASKNKKKRHETKEWKEESKSTNTPKSLRMEQLAGPPAAAWRMDVNASYRCSSSWKIKVPLQNIWSPGQLTELTEVHGNIKNWGGTWMHLEIWFQGLTGAERGRNKCICPAMSNVWVKERMLIWVGLQGHIQWELDVWRSRGTLYSIYVFIVYFLGQKRFQKHRQYGYVGILFDT